MKYILDASVAIKWVLPEPDSPKALTLWVTFKRKRPSYWLQILFQ